MLNKALELNETIARKKSSLCAFFVPARVKLPPQKNVRTRALPFNLSWHYHFRGLSLAQSKFWGHSV